MVFVCVFVFVFQIAYGDTVTRPAHLLTYLVPSTIHHSFPIFVLALFSLYPRRVALYPLTQAFSRLSTLLAAMLVSFLHLKRMTDV